MTFKRAALVWLLQGARRREFRYIFNQVILPGPEDARICFTFFLQQRGISTKMKEVKKVCY